MNIRPLTELLAMTKEKIDEALAPIRASAVRAKVDLKLAEINEKKITLERQVFEALTARELSIDTVLSRMDEYDLADRKSKQLQDLVDKLFAPSKS